MDVDLTGPATFPGGLDTTIVPFGGTGPLLFEGRAVSTDDAPQFQTEFAEAHEYVTSDEGQLAYRAVNEHLRRMTDELNARLAERDDSQAHASGN